MVSDCDDDSFVPSDASNTIVEATKISLQETTLDEEDDDTIEGPVLPVSRAARIQQAREAVVVGKTKRNILHDRHGEKAITHLMMLKSIKKVTPPHTQQQKKYSRSKFHWRGDGTTEKNYGCNA